MMKEIRIHGRAGQGAITTAILLVAAAVEDGKEALAFPHFGAERMGAPLNAYVRLSDAPILLRTQIQQPDYLIILDPTLLWGFNISQGYRKGGRIIINTTMDTSKLCVSAPDQVVSVPAAEIAQELLGRADRANTAILGAFAAATGEVTLESLQKVARQRFSGVVGEKNAQALQRAYDLVKQREEA